MTDNPTERDETGQSSDSNPHPEWDLVTRSAVAGAVGALTVLVVIGGLLGGAIVDPGGPGDTTTTTAPPSTETAVPDPNRGLADLDNPGGLPDLVGESLMTRSQVEAAGFANPDWTEPISPQDNGGSPQGQFRLICTASHLRFDDPIIFPGQPGAAHLHLFFGNTSVDASTTADSLMESGGSTCQGGPLNRSGYWIPAMVDDQGNAVLPQTITLYYKSHRPQDAQELPQGVKMLAGNIGPEGGHPQASFNRSEALSWGCYDPNLGRATRTQSMIPGTAGTPRCPASMPIRATIQFPQCFAVDRSGNPVLESDDFLSHTYRLGSDPARRNENQNSPCPPSHPYRTPQISYLVDWANPGASVSTWRLSSDHEDTLTPGGSLHGDWWGGWMPEAIATWHDNCITARRNCSLGQTSTPLRFDPLTGTQMGTGGRNQMYVGPQLLALP